MRNRYLFIGAIALGAAAGLAGRPAAPAAAEAAALEAEIAAWLQQTWHPSGTVRGAVGWRDNLLLSPFAPLARAFGRTEVEAMLLRPPRDRWEFVAFLSGDVLRYFSPPPESRGEQQWALHSEIRWQPVDPARLSLKAVGFLRDMVIDLSETEDRRVVAPTRVRGASAVAATRLTLPAGFRLEPMAQVRRSDYRALSGDYDETRTGGRLEWRSAAVWTLTASWFDVRRDYAERVNYTAGGRPLAGTRLAFRQRDGEVKVRAAWSRADHAWSAAVTVGRLQNRDQASGYFDYDQERARWELEWRRGPWRAVVEAEGRRTEYRLQTVGAGLAPPPRRADDYETTGRVERALAPGWTIFGEYRWERSRSNEAEFNYRTNTVLAGVQYEF